MTNLEKYQTMTAEEFAEWLRLIADSCGGCDYGEGICQFRDHCPCDTCYPQNKKEFIEWLESEVDAS